MSIWTWPWSLLKQLVRANSLLINSSSPASIDAMSLYNAASASVSQNFVQSLPSGRCEKKILNWSLIKEFGIEFYWKFEDVGKPTAYTDVPPVQGCGSGYRLSGSDPRE